uniref:Uncharacterized protein n=1 Tax=Physcomitrium patens TaxID=3218 RepID=A0A2K1JZK1_PHYPA|nr:hypothetical protein PHYPA_014068 [Physcomitrium patens]
MATTALFANYLYHEKGAVSLNRDGRTAVDFSLLDVLVKSHDGGHASRGHVFLERVGSMWDVAVGPSHESAALQSLRTQLHLFDNLESYICCSRSMGRLICYESVVFMKVVMEISAPPDYDKKIIDWDEIGDITQEYKPGSLT